MTDKFQIRKKWFRRLGALGLLQSIGILAITDVLPSRTSFAWMPWALLLLCLVGVAIPYALVFNPAKPERLLNARAKTPHTPAEIAEVVSRVGATLSFTPLMYGLIAFVVTGQSVNYWIFVPIAVVIGVAYWKRTLSIIESVEYLGGNNEPTR